MTSKSYPIGCYFSWTSYMPGFVGKGIVVEIAGSIALVMHLA